LLRSLAPASSADPPLSLANRGIFPVQHTVPPSGDSVLLLGNLKVCVLFGNDIFGPLPASWGKFDKMQVGAHERRRDAAAAALALPICGTSGQNFGLSGGDPPNPPSGRRAKQSVDLRGSEREDAAAAAASGATRS
jgi:hypothetical protein